VLGHPYIQESLQNVYNQLYGGSFRLPIISFVVLFNF